MTATFTSIIPDVIVGDSPIHGQGTFTGRHYNCGDKIPIESPEHLNHSCDPSAAFVERNGTFGLYALRPMNSMTEITIDYSLTAPENSWDWGCRCQTAKCRKSITTYASLPAEIRARYEYLKIAPQ